MGSLILESRRLGKMLSRSSHDLELIDQNEPATIPTGLFFILPVPIGEPYATPWQTHPATLHLNCPPEQNAIIYKKVVNLLQNNQAPFTLSTQPDLQTEADQILVHGINLSANGLDLLVSVQPDVLPEGPVQIYPTP